VATADQKVLVLPLVSELPKGPVPKLGRMSMHRLLVCLCFQAAIVLLLGAQGLHGATSTGLDGVGGMVPQRQLKFFKFLSFNPFGAFEDAPSKESS
jgi:hypothetical protein